MSADVAHLTLDRGVPDVLALPPCPKRRPRSWRRPPPQSDRPTPPSNSRRTGSRRGLAPAVLEVRDIVAISTGRWRRVGRIPPGRHRSDSVKSPPPPFWGHTVPVDALCDIEVLVPAPATLFWFKLAEITTDEFESQLLQSRLVANRRPRGAARACSTGSAAT